MAIDKSQEKDQAYSDFILALIHKTIDYYRNLDGLNAVPTNGNGNGSEKSLLAKQFAEAMREFREALNSPATKSEKVDSYTIPITINVPPMTVNVPPSTVNVNVPKPSTPIVNVKAPVVNVAAPNVEVTNEVNPTPVEITNDVQPTPVSIQNQVESPMVVNRVEVKTETPAVEPKPQEETVIIERGKDGRISGMTKKMTK